MYIREIIEKEYWKLTTKEKIQKFKNNFKNYENNKKSTKYKIS